MKEHCRALSTAGGGGAVEEVLKGVVEELGRYVLEEVGGDILWEGTYNVLMGGDMPMVVGGDYPGRIHWRTNRIKGVRASRYQTEYGRRNNRHLFAMPAYYALDFLHH